MKFSKWFSIGFLLWTLKIAESCSVLRGEAYGDILNGFSAKDCRLKRYREAETGSCVSKLAASNADTKGKSTWHISFMGDSRIRQMYNQFSRVKLDWNEVLLELLPTYDTITSQRMFPSDKPQHEHSSVTSPLLGAIVSHRWRTYPDEHMEADLRSWITDEHAAPDVLVTGHMLWTMQRVLREPFEAYKRNMTNIVKLLKELSSKKTTVIWWEQDYSKEKFYHSFARFHFGKTPPTPNIDTNKIRKYNGFVKQLIKGSDIILWDSTHKLFDEFRRGCTLAPNRNDDKWFWKCLNDAFHPGFLFVNIYIQQFLNFLCNPLTETGGQYCCTDRANNKLNL